MPITIIRPEDRDIQPVGDAVPGAPAETAKRSGRQILSSADPYVQLTRVEAGTTVPRHSHAAPEAMIVLSGALVVDGQRCEPGTIFLIPANEQYGFDVADDGDVTLCVVRPESGGFQAAG